MTQLEIWAEMARRKVQFHNDEEWQTIHLWGLFQWQHISKLLKSGLLVTDMEKESEVLWVQPSKEAYHKHIEPLIAKHTLEELKQMADWYWR
jgi:hypothetical protein